MGDPTYFTRNIMKTSRHWLCAFVFVATSQFAAAQVITNAEVERGLRYPNNTIPFDGAPTTARYNYGLWDANVYVNGNSQQLWGLLWQDRAERAAKFGYAPPKSYELTPQPAFPRVRAFFADGGFGWRR
jgi:hypothetical protein